ncbi:alpha/beta fold hydrolase [Streptomyces sp. I05A-00742]|uniref:alpha/beta fold hydrolase n=1 Tax=Streptomyces sp. I05A-00742 TaxID=2732853 RepID=UPI001487925A|nr:alpha/beta hydrolase [Streptomyces sp. I05A-00742]
MPTFTAHDGTTLAYHSLGEGEPLLCLPGGPMRASVYLGDLGGLAKHRRLIKLDLRGTGDSGTPDDPATYRPDRQVEDVEALWDHLGLERADALAHSAAGDLALLHAARYPDRVRGLVLVTPRARAVGVRFTGEHRMEVAALRADEPWFEAVFPSWRAAWEEGTATDADWDAVVPFFYGRWDAEAQAHAAAEAGQSNEEAAEVYAAAGGFDPAATRAALAPLGERILILAGELDSGPLPRIASAVAESVPGSEVAVQPGAGHFPWLDDPGHFTGTVVSFLDRVRRSGS